MQEHFLGSVQRAAMELIREKEREETSKLWSCFVQRPLIPLTGFPSVPNKWLPPGFMLERQQSV